MKTHWVFNDCNSEKSKSRNYWENKQARIERLLSNYGPDLRRLRLTVYRYEVRKEWQFRAVLHLPTGTLVADSLASTLEEAIDEVADDLAREIRRHKSKVRGDHLIRKRRRRKGELAEVLPYLAQDAAESNSASFSSLLITHMDEIYDQAKRELKILELEESIPVGEWNARDVVDEVLVRACETYDRRPDGTSIDAWLISLLNDRLDEIRDQISPISLVSPTEITVDDDDDLADLQFWLRELLEPSEPVSLDELLPDDEFGDVWSALSNKEQVSRLTQELRSFPKRQRQSLILRFGYGFEIGEVASALNCADADIEADLHTGQEKLRQAFTDPQQNSSFTQGAVDST